MGRNRGGVGSRDRERAARSGFATRIGSGSARSWGRRTDRGSARAAIGSLPNVVAKSAAGPLLRGEMKTIQVKEPGDRIAGFPLSDSAGGDDAGWDTSRESLSILPPGAGRDLDTGFRDAGDSSERP